MLRLGLRLRLGGGVVGSVLVATLDSVHSTFIEIQLRLRLRLRLRLGGGVVWISASGHAMLCT